MMTFKQFLVESKNLYHLTNVASAIGILKNGLLKNSSLSTSNRSGFFSMMIGADAVMIVIDRNKIKNDVKQFKNIEGSKELASLGLHSNEYEVRNVEDLNIADAVRVIRILSTGVRSKGTNFYTEEQLKELQELAEQRHIPIEFVSTRTKLRAAKI